MKADARAYHKRASCDGKQVFDSWAAAQRVERRRSRRGKDRERLVPYRCVHCQKIHLGEPS